jgi:hypothetical protein
MRRAHPRFQRAKKMFDSLPPDSRYVSTLSNRLLILSKASSCSQRAIRRFVSVVHWDLIGHMGQDDDQYL